jgi:hypothetical protein
MKLRPAVRRIKSGMRRLMGIKMDQLQISATAVSSVLDLFTVLPARAEEPLPAPDLLCP